MRVSGIFLASTKHCMLFHFVRWYKLEPKLTSSKGQVLAVRCCLLGKLGQQRGRIPDCSAVP